MTVDREHNYSDQDFAYLAQADPRTTELVAELKQELPNEIHDGHGSFWLGYMQKYDVIARATRKAIEDDNVDVGQHPVAVSEWMSDVLRPAIVATNQSGFFKKNSTGFEHVDASYAYEFISRQMDEEEILDNQPLIFEIPSVLTELLTVAR